VNTVADLGSKLRDGRQRRGLTLHDISRTTKIPTSSLAAIERNDFETLPGGIFRRAYVRSFAREVGVDPEPLPLLVVGEASDETRVDSRPHRWRRHTPTVIALGLVLAMFLIARALGGSSDAGATPVDSPIATGAAPAPS
jgi:cytoskeletal protein RodZ